MRALILALTVALAWPVSGVAATDEPPSGSTTVAGEPLMGSFTAIAAPMPYPFWNDLGHRCNAGIEPVHKTSIPFSAPEDGLLTIAAEGLVGDWDLFILAADGAELAGSNRTQAAGSTNGSERATTLLAAGQAVSLMACNQQGAPVAEVGWTFEPLDPATIGVSVSIGDAGAVNYFDEQTVTITAGEAVAWRVVEGTQPHTVTANDDSFRGGTIIGGTYARVFDTPGVYDYFCEYHGAPGLFPQTQTGRIVVEPAD